jgi:hypothetical protein
MEDGAGPPLRSGDQLAERMAELQRLVQAGLLSADDIAEEVTQLKAEAKAWRARSAAAASAGAQLAPHVTAAALAAPPPGPAPRVGKLSPADATPAVQAHSSQASSLSNSASSWWRWVALRSGTACNVQHAYGESHRPHAQFLKNRSGAARRTLARFLTTGFLKGGPTLYRVGPPVRKQELYRASLFLNPQVGLPRGIGTNRWASRGNKGREPLNFLKLS